MAMRLQGRRREGAVAAQGVQRADGGDRRAMRDREQRQRSAQAFMSNAGVRRSTSTPTAAADIADARRRATPIVATGGSVHAQSSARRRRRRPRRRDGRAASRLAGLPGGISPRTGRSRACARRRPDRTTCPGCPRTRAGRDAAVGIALVRVVDEAAGLADPRVSARSSPRYVRRGHVTRVRATRAPVGRDVKIDRPAPGEELNTRRGDGAAPGGDGDRAARRRPTTLEVLLVRRNAEGALHGRRVGVPRRRGRRARGRGRRGRTGVAAVRELEEEAGIASSRPGGAREVLALDHAGRGQDPLRHALLPRRRCPTARSRRSTASECVDFGWLTPAGRARGAPRGELAARLPDDQAPRAARGLRDGGRRCSRHARGREVVAGRAAGRARATARVAWCCPASRATTTRLDAVTGSAIVRGDDASLPTEVQAVFDRFITTEYVTIDARGQPITWPVTPYYRAGRRLHRRDDRHRLPEEGQRRRANPHVALLFSDPTGSGLDDAPMVLVQGTARRRRRRPRREPRRATRASRPRSCRALQGAARRSACGACSAGTTRASTSTCGPSGSTCGTTATRPPSRSCSTPTWRRSAPGTPRSPRRAHASPRAARPPGTSASSELGAPYPTAVLVDRRPRTASRSRSASRSASTAAPSRVQIDADAAGAPLEPGLACLTAHAHAPGLHLAAQLPGPRRPDRTGRPPRAPPAPRRRRAAAAVVVVRALPRERAQDPALPQDGARPRARQSRRTPRPFGDRDAEAPLGLADDVVLAVARGVLVADEHDHAVGRKGRERVLQREQRLALAGLARARAPSARARRRSARRPTRRRRSPRRCRTPRTRPRTR